MQRNFKANGIGYEKSTVHRVKERTEGAGPKSHVCRLGVSVSFIASPPQSPLGCSAAQLTCLLQRACGTCVKFLELFSWFPKHLTAFLTLNFIKWTILTHNCSSKPIATLLSCPELCHDIGTSMFLHIREFLFQGSTFLGMSVCKGQWDYKLAVILCAFLLPWICFPRSHV